MILAKYAKSHGKEVWEIHYTDYPQCCRYAFPWEGRAKIFHSSQMRTPKGQIDTILEQFQRDNPKYWEV